MDTLPQRFGPRFWCIIHLEAKRYDWFKRDRKRYHKEITAIEAFLTHLPHLLPCPMCTGHSIEFYETSPPPFDSDEMHAMFQWSVDHHNAANVHTGKREWTLEEALVAYRDEWVQSPERNLDLSRAAQKRQEDHFKIRTLEQDVAREERAKQLYFVLMVCFAVTLGIMLMTLSWILLVRWRNQS